MISHRLSDMLLRTSVIIVTFSQIMKSEKHADTKVRLFQWVEKALFHVFFFFLLRMEVWEASREERPQNIRQPNQK